MHLPYAWCDFKGRRPKKSRLQVEHVNGARAYIGFGKRAAFLEESKSTRTTIYGKFDASRVQDG